MVYIPSYADDKIPYKGYRNFLSYADQITAQTVLKWFEQNYMKASSEKWHLLLSADKAAPININRYNETNSQVEILLDTTNSQVEILLISHLKTMQQISVKNKSSQKSNPLAEILDRLEKELNNSIYYSTILLLFTVWVFRRGRVNNHINKIHDRAHKLTYMHDRSSFDMLLKKY